MKLIRTVAPTLNPVPITDVVDHLRVDESAFDRWYIEQLLNAAIDRLDGPNGWLGRALVTQTWRLVLPGFPEGGQGIALPVPPVQSVAAVRYTDASGATATMLPADYRLSGAGTDEARLLLPAGVSAWPEVQAWDDAVMIDFVTGHAADWRGIPPTIRAAILEMIGSSYANRESVSPGAQFSELPRSAVDALAHWKVWSFG